MQPYGNYFPATYQPPNPYQPFQQQGFQQQMQPPPQTAQQPTSQQMPPIQNGGFVNVRSYGEVDGWAMAPGSSVTFFVESNPPFLCVKTRGFSQLDTPTIEVFDLVKRKPPQSVQNEPVSPAPMQGGSDVPYALKSDLDALRGALANELDNFRAEFAKLNPDSPKKTASKTKKESDEA